MFGSRSGGGVSFSTCKRIASGPEKTTACHSSNGFNGKPVPEARFVIEITIMMALLQQAVEITEVTARVRAISRSEWRRLGAF